MSEDVGARLAQAAGALLAGRLPEACALYQACAPDAPHLAALGLALVAWLQGDYQAIGDRAARAIAAAPTEGFPHGFARTLEGLAWIHAGRIREGLARQAEGLAAARAAGDGTELNASVAIAAALVHLGRWREAAATLDAVGPQAAEGGPLARLLIDRLRVALDALSGAAGHAVAPARVQGDTASTQVSAAGRLEAAVASARAEGDEAALAHALAWRGDAAQAAALAERTGQLDVLARAHLALGNYPLARQHARAGGDLALELAIDLARGGAAALEARRKLDALLAPLGPEERAAFLAYPGRSVGVPDVGVEALERLGKLLTHASAEPDPRAMLAAALAAFVELAGAERGFLLRLDGFQVLDQLIHGAAPDAYSTSLADRVAWSGEPLVVEDLEADVELGGSASVQELGLRMALGMPLLAEGKVVGVMLADGRQAHPGFGAEVLAMARALADHVAAAIGLADRTRALQTDLAVEAALARAALAAAAAASVEAALPALAREAAAGLHTERLFLCLGPDLTCVAALDAEGRPLKDARPSQGAVRWVAGHGEPLVVQDARVDETFASRASVQELGLQTIHAAPVRVAGLTAGVLYLDGNAGQAPPPGAHKLLEGLAAIIAAVVARQPARTGRKA